MFITSSDGMIWWRFEGRGSFTYLTGGKAKFLGGYKSEDILVPYDDHFKRKVQGRYGG